MVLGFEKEISSGINGVACGEPWESLKGADPYSTKNFK